MENVQLSKKITCDRRTTKYESRGRELRRNKRRITNKDSTANVGDLVKMESQGHLIFRVTCEIDKIGISDVRTHRGCG